MNPPPPTCSPYFSILAKPSTHLLRFQIGPVQEFIAQARSTRDLWSGSYLLSWLVAVGIRALQAAKGNLIFPSATDGSQPLLQEPLPKDNPEALLTPNLPNVFIARIGTRDPQAVAHGVEKAIRGEWKHIADAVWDKRQEYGLPDSQEDRFFSLVERHLSIAWQVTEYGQLGYAEAYRLNSWHLDAVRQTRNFQAAHPHSSKPEDGHLREKDSLTGKEEALLGREKFLQARKEQGGRYSALFKHADYLGAVSLIKRFWHLAWLKKKMGIDVETHRIRSIPAIAARKHTHSDDQEENETAGDEKYIAAIAFDGDSIGKWVNGDFLEDKSTLEEHHIRFSKALSTFALGKVRNIVEGTKQESSGQRWQGQLIYAGGDDVVCIVPAEDALRVARELRVAFRRCMTPGPRPAKGGKRPRPDASAGIAIAHIHAPLQDLIREAQKAEKRAKYEGPRPAFSVTLIKRSGEISH